MEEDPGLSDDISVHLENILLHGSKNVNSLRAAVARNPLAAEFGENGPCDAVQFLFELIYNKGLMSTKFNTMFALYKRMVAVCKNCLTERTIGSSEGELLRCIYINPVGISLTLEEWVKRSFVDKFDARCDSDVCQGVKQNHEERSLVIIGPRQRYLAIQFERRVIAEASRNERRIRYVDGSLAVLSNSGECFTFRMCVKHDSGVEVNEGSLVYWCFVYWFGISFRCSISISVCN